MSRALRPLDEAFTRKYFVEDRALLAAAPREARHYLEGCCPCYDPAPETSDTREHLPV